MKIIVLVVIAICVSSQPNLVIQQTLTEMYGDSDGVLQCIAKLDTKMQANSVSKFCGDEWSDNRKCYTSYSSFKLCLINNKCQNTFDEQSVFPLLRLRLVSIAGIVGRTWWPTLTKWKITIPSYKNVPWVDLTLLAFSPFSPSCF